MHARDVDLFGDPVLSPEEARQEELKVGRSKAVDQLREGWRRLESRSLRSPDDEILARKARKAKEAYLSLRDYHELHGGLSLETMGARAAAMDEEDRGIEMDPMVGELFDGRD